MLFLQMVDRLSSKVNPSVRLGSFVDFLFKLRDRLRHSNPLTNVIENVVYVITEGDRNRVARLSVTPDEHVDIPFAVVNGSPVAGELDAVAWAGP